MIGENHKFQALTSRVIGAAMNVHNTLGNGFQEKIYQNALEIELRILGLSFIREFEMPIFYRDQEIGSRRVDFLINRLLSVELKAITHLEPVHYAQAINYLEAYNLEVGLLINFGDRSLKFNRLTNKKFNPNKPIVF